MLKKLYALKNKKGFTLVELMVVVAILGILVAVAVPVYNNATEKAAKQTDEANARTLTSAVSQIKTMNDGKLQDGTKKTIVEGTVITKDSEFYDGEKSVKLAPTYVAEFPELKSSEHNQFTIDANGIVTASQAVAPNP